MFYYITSLVLPPEVVDYMGFGPLPSSSFYKSATITTIRIVYWLIFGVCTTITGPNQKEKKANNNNNYVAIFYHEHMRL